MGDNIAGGVDDTSSVSSTLVEVSSIFAEVSSTPVELSAAVLKLPIISGTVANGYEVRSISDTFEGVTEMLEMLPTLFGFRGIHFV